MRLILTGASGQLGAYLLRQLRARGHEVHPWSGSDTGTRDGMRPRPVDLADPDAVEDALNDTDAGAILHAGAVSSAALAYREPVRAAAVNVEGTARLADWCRARGRRLLYTSTDLVFDGSRAWNREDDPAEPLLVYGRTKRDAEPAVLAVPGGVVARLCLLYGPSRSGRPSFFDGAVADLRAGVPRAFFEDEYRTPLDYATAAAILVRLLESDARGLIHVAGVDRMSRFDLMRRCAEALGLDAELVRANRQADVPGPEPRPADVSLDTSRLANLLPDLDRPGPARVLVS